MIVQKVTDENDSVALVGTRLHPFRFGDVERQRFLTKTSLPASMQRSVVPVVSVTSQALATI